MVFGRESETALTFLLRDQVEPVEKEKQYHVNFLVKLLIFINENMSKIKLNSCVLFEFTCLNDLPQKKANWSRHKKIASWGMATIEKKLAS